MIKKVFITGGSTGIGASLVKKYLEMGYEVGTCGRSMEKFKLNFPHENPKLHFYSVDVTNRTELQKSIADFSQGHLDLLIANAGVATHDKKPIPDWRKGEELLNINIHGVLYAIESALEVMKTQGHGQMVIISSVAGKVGLPGAAHYSASKAALLAFGESISISLAKFNIIVTTIAPGFIKTPLTDKNNHPMPFIISSDAAADHIIWAINKKLALYLFPWKMRYVIQILSALPRSVYRAIMKLRFG